MVPSWVLNDGYLINQPQTWGLAGDQSRSDVTAIPPSPGRYHCAQAVAEARCPAFFHRSEPIRDRKSTRLNSSHLVISYAVFCLKKKKSSLTAHLASLHLVPSPSGRQ